MNVYGAIFDDNYDWNYISKKKKTLEDKDRSKIQEPCWFYNNGGCRNKDGSEKCAENCKYLHVYSDNLKRPSHLNNKKPCDKFNIDGECKWNDNCKYSHRTLTNEEWSKYYPTIPFMLRKNIQKKVNRTILI